MSFLGYVGSRFIYPFAENYTQRDILSKLSALRQHNQYLPEQKKVIQRTRVTQTLAYAAFNVPYYKELFKNKPGLIEKISKDFSYFDDVPYLTKDLIREHHERLISEEFKSAFLHIRRTNGSTGASLEVKYSQDDLDWAAASNLYAYDLCGRDMSQLEVHLSSRFNSEPKHLKNQMYGVVKNLSLNRRNIFTRNFDDQSLRVLYESLKKKAPYQVQGHPSTLFALASFVRRTMGQPQNLFKVFESTGESLTLAVQLEISKWLGCKIFNRYGNAEVGVMAHSLANAQELEILDFMIYPENFLVNSAQCELVVTSLYNRAMPYIRYQTGDMGEVFEKKGLSYIRKLSGRVHDIVEIEDNLIPTQFIQDVISQLNEIEQFQIKATNKSKVSQLHLVPKKELSEGEKNNILFFIRDYFGTSFSISFVQSSELVRTGWTSKFRHLVSEEQ